MLKPFLRIFIFAPEFFKFALGILGVAPFFNARAPFFRTALLTQIICNHSEMVLLSTPPCNTTLQKISDPLFEGRTSLSKASTILSNLGTIKK